MSNNNNNTNLIPALAIVIGVVILVALGSLYAFRQEDETIQGQAEVSEYRVSSKVPGRILAFYVKEGDTVKAGDTLAILEAPEITAKMEQAQAAKAAASAQNEKAIKGARKEQINAAYELWQKAKAGKTIAEKSYARVKRLFDAGVMTAQKLDEVTAQRDAAIATERAAFQQYNMAKNGAEREDKMAAQALVERAQGAINEVESYIGETILTASHDGEVTEIFPQIGELVGSGAPIMNVALMDEIWGTFNIREDHLSRFGMHQEFKGTIPALDGRSVTMKVYYIKDLGSYAAWKATKSTGQFDMKTFEVKASFTQEVKGLRPGMSILYEK